VSSTKWLYQYESFSPSIGRFVPLCRNLNKVFKDAGESVNQNQTIRHVCWYIESNLTIARNFY
jgi:hypothetical protein